MAQVTDITPVKEKGARGEEYRSSGSAENFVDDEDGDEHSFVLADDRLVT